MFPKLYLFLFLHRYYNEGLDYSIGPLDSNLLLPQIIIVTDSKVIFLTHNSSHLSSYFLF